VKLKKGANGTMYISP